MKKVFTSLLLGLCLLPLMVEARQNKSDEEIIAALYRGAYAYWQQARNDNGTYEDKLFLKQTSSRGSIANSGMGIVAMTIGHANGWEPEAEKLIIQSLEVLAGKSAEISVPRNAHNIYIHFYNTEIGEAMGDDWSPVDSAIMLSGALFAKRYFPDNMEIAALVDELYRTTDLTGFIASVDTGHIYLAQNIDGTFKPNRTKVFNEYMLVASIARQQAIDFGYGDDSPAIRFWDKWYAQTDNLPVAHYGKIPVLSEGKGWFTSQFNYLFNNYLIHGFSDSEEFRKAFLYAAAADYAWWRGQRIRGKESYEWGSGAGACPRGYCVDRIRKNANRDSNDYMIVSPHILSGYMPYVTRAKADLIATYRDEDINALYELEGGYEVLWRYSYVQPRWRAKAIEGVDFSTFLFGLAALPEHLGMEFFNTHNDYFNPEPANYKKPKK